MAMQSPQPLMSSLMKQLDPYQISLAPLKADYVNNHDREVEDDDVATIPVMVDLTQIMFKASHLLYHSLKNPMDETSQFAMPLDNELEQWETNYSLFLNVDAATVNDPEWAFKRKLVLRLRFYNARTLLHRPFLAASTYNQHPSLL
ncbi:fungal specific transcription factor domain-containing protein [Aspergillus alliaceus]|uniref:fungal specific transcription factor domain-containing protein n=1 Tax=Petromyces alliaceus TaxID=209559 RepID=UPI0012A50E66|nr:uncharacterized protein BDW43DRAFT_315228 [Aspergillus alliaceus]KAB8229243.1 hypothetical protein BDW43DRAFT_315228 [Aspergillus alliaceus]